MAPIAIYINNEQVWADDDSAFDEIISKYNEVISRTDLVSSIEFTIVEFHHSIVKITTILK